MRTGYVASIICAAVLTTSLLLARVHPFGNAGLNVSMAAQANIMTHSEVPRQVREILTAKCADCHSLRTQAPVYSRLAPASWLMERDIVAGRAHMNLSSWDNYSSDQQQTFKAEIVQEVKTNAMPLPQYRLIHWKSRITDGDIQILTQWARGTPSSEPGAIAEYAEEGDAARGKEVFEKRCTGCHAIDRNREGPALKDVFGRTAGSVAGFTYSPGLVKAHIVWNSTTLNAWLADPDGLIPGNNMEFHIAKPQERQDLISFLKQESGK